MTPTSGQPIKIKTEVKHMAEQILSDLQNLKLCKDAAQVEVMTKRVFEYLDADKNGFI